LNRLDTIVATPMRVLVLAQRLPYAPNRGDRLRVYHSVRQIASRASVDVAALVHDDDEASHAGDLEGIAEHVIAARVPRVRRAVRAATSLASRTPLTHALLDSPVLVPALTRLVRQHRPDVTLAFCSSMARFAMASPLSEIPCVIDMIDADSAKWATLGKVGSRPLRWIYKREARLLGAFEATAMQRAFRTLVVNEKERAALLALAPGSRVQVMENGVDLASFTPPHPPPDSASVVFCGVMNYSPNEAGAVWLANRVWPLVRAARPDAQLQIVGATPSPQVCALASEVSGVTVTGAVPDVRRYLWDAAVAVAPLQVARGVQNKVLEAVAAGLPCVVTKEVAEGLPREVAPACLVSGDAAQFAAEICRLLDLPPARRRAMASGTDLTPLQWSVRLRPLVPLLESAARR
jgi:sugar transferase (PEP-CTERM/EpsH1 system associated)